VTVTTFDLNAAGFITENQSGTLHRHGCGLVVITDGAWWWTWESGPGLNRRFPIPYPLEPRTLAELEVMIERCQEALRPSTTTGEE
jgi:hypothetical protein